MNAVTAEARPGFALSDAKLETLNSAVSGLSQQSLIWSSGYLAGLAAVDPGVHGATVAEASASAPASRLSILYGSQTGNGQRVAEQIALGAAQRSIAARVISLADYRVQELKRESAVFLIVSTHGDGDPPDDAEELHEYLSGSRAPQLPGLSFGVLALGDSSYANFCQTGRDFDERLGALGATRLLECVECDLDFEEPSARWTELALAKATEIAVADNTPRGPSLRAVSAARYSAVHPFPAELTVNQKISARDSGKDVRHIEFSLENSGLSYEPGDALGVVTLNPPELIDELLSLLGVAPDTPIAGSGIRAELSARHEITVASASFVERYANLSGADELARLSNPAERTRLAEYLDDRQIIDIVREYPCRPAAAEFVACLRRFKPRLYSIASSPLASPDDVAITVAAVRYEAFGRPHHGAASTHLADRAESGATLGIYVEPNPRFRLPADTDTPVIMIGPGTGVAPFRAFLQQREAQGARGPNWLFFGDREFANDFLYQLDWARWRKNGVLNRMDVAFSRDQEHKIYVQHRLRERAADLYAWAERGAHIYVCGDSKHMAADVQQTLVDVIATQRGRSDEEAIAYLKAMRRAGRYQRDVY